MDFITPTKSIHHNMVSDIECCTYAQDELNWIVVDAYDRNSVFGDKSKSKIHVTISKTQRVRQLFKREKQLRDE